MALTKCKACGAEMSKKAPICPKCGHPNKEANYLSGGQVLMGFAVAIAAIWFMATRDSGSSSGGKAASQSVPYEAVQACQDRMRSQAMHPSTVKFHITGQSTDRGAPGGGYRVRLGFSAKNSFGLETRYDSLCKFAPNSLTITEAGAWEKGS